ncbi:GlxA family transcriptional regulator [Alteromonas halophila]|uniref:Transcriptional regulator n=1 Tax=Alteromonas halophila TaxID=516698 RepID=A0A918JQ54_9ALTE|nr:helix-turn-helix domain-containing protein [Alteromonas halophila]GGW95557.1 transcriptional regulator [Alteromonas halophila]
MPLTERKVKVTIVGFDQALSSAITGALDLFALAGVSWQRIHGQPVEPLFDVSIAGLHGSPFSCTNQLSISPHCALEDVQHTDLLIVPTIGGDIAQVLKQNQRLLTYLQRHASQQTDIAGNCTGTFLLAAAGLLENRIATTHWGYADTFRRMFPGVLLQPEKMLTQQDNLFCAGGGMAWFDLSLLLIRRYCGHQVATDTAKSLVLDLTRPNQTVYASTRQRKFHQDPDILAVQTSLEEAIAAPLSLPALASRHNMTVRTLLRRFQKACGQTPLKYLQALRVEYVMAQLETRKLPLESLLHEVGYEDVSSFSRLFKRQTGMSPAQYRAKFTAGDVQK